jgi:CheY-like chemotaxis protein
MMLLAWVKALRVTFVEVKKISALFARPCTRNKIKIESPSRRLLLIALSGYGQESDQQRSKEAGFNAHMVKPVEMEQVEEILDSLTSERRP